MTHLNYRNATAHINPQKGFRIHLLVFLLVTPAVWLVWYLANKSYPWPLWSTKAWVIGILFHYLGAFVFKKSKNN